LLFKGRPTLGAMMEMSDRVTSYNSTVDTGHRVKLSLELEKPRRVELCTYNYLHVNDI